ncbi:hypothetical protein Q1695_012063 [Nippostrongylus brasiliensis]|nr:hypothetical protein Q1695_012063 [Nippostrongylus brasiliensis]
MAFRRLEGTIAKLRSNPELLQQYHDTFTYQLSRGIIEEVDESRTTKGIRVHYLAHHAVVTPHKETTKLRMVFDASAHRQGAHSLNDVLHKGPAMLPPLKTTENMVTYRFTRVTFGLNCSPFLLAGTLHYHMENYIPDQQLAEQLQESTYVDNVILTSNTVDESLQLYRKLKNIFGEINMNLRQFRSNDDDVNGTIAKADLSTNSQQKVLGILWTTEKDTLTIKCQYPAKKKLTKRTVSEQVSSIYDPHGWLTPLTLAGKLFFQQLWKETYDWDTPLSPKHRKRWMEIVDGANGFQYEMPRKVAAIAQEGIVVVFSDASNQCAAACAYLVQNATSTLLIGKSKLTSMRSQATVPKMELNALTIATRLANCIYSALRKRMHITDIVILSDSEIALNWIRNKVAATTAGIMVNNRVKEIRKIAENLPVRTQYGFIRTTLNPADCATRGVNKFDFHDHIWWKGPSFITTPLESWPKECRPFVLEICDDNDAVCMTSKTYSAQQVTELLDWKRHNNMRTCVTTVGHVLRFIRILIRRVNDKLRARMESTIPELRSTTSEPYVTAAERKQALNVLIRNHQAVHVPDQRRKAQKQLKLQMDSHGVLRCRGRLDNTNVTFDARQPIFVQTKTPRAEAIVKENHTPLHCGTVHTIANVRRKFWIPKLRQLVRHVIRGCVPCQRMNNLPYRYPHMDDLPEFRVRRTRPFESVGIDYFGPITARENDVEKKFYGIILTCTITRLVHLELVPNMTTDHLLQTLRRFFARRGVPKTIISDNGPYFLLADQILRDSALPIADDTIIARALAVEGITWKTITPYAPWQGAFYERLIKSVKHSLFKALRGATTTKDNLETLLIEVEGMLNSRPLTYQEERWEEAPILRPVDFIQPEITITFPFENARVEAEDASYLPPDETLQLKTRRQVEEALSSAHRFTEKFWKIWNQQYLTGLRESHKLDITKQRSSNKTPKVGKVVLVMDPVLPRNAWKIAKITKLKPNSGSIREAELRTPNGRTIRRPINQLIPLEIDDDETNEGAQQSTSTSTDGPRYNLRPRKNGAVEGPEYREYDSLFPSQH